MLFKAVFSVLALASAVAAAPPKENPPVFTATRAVQTITDVAPFIITKTTVTTWTQSPSTKLAHPTGPGL
ncbi:hypothetical protein DFH06DRAFT_1466459 [Mycena polygramma]|nr:hypothetical protein DFH06DRAFT_1489132 [Mycena polygramma]KAJ7675620.1 hypothetical protein DFH06DRAFT_1466459 [Mycena polygramma]